MKKFLAIIFIILMICVAFFGYTYFTGHRTSVIAQTDAGYVTKEVDNFYESDKTMVIITGIHPRETLAIDPEIESARLFALRNQVNMIIYNVTVTRDPTDYAKGRANGEKLVADYVVPDIMNTDAKVVIISHSHIPTYGEGYYVATPEMDDASVKLATDIKNGGISFNYYPKTGNEEYNSTSAVLVSKPVARAGYPTLVYEIPEDISSQEATLRTQDLLDKCYELLF
ncbi:MAG: hypothetical protein BZ136_03730 [Methanosphaera sp. rholeuAM74]|nr:MAG: hypothetical protein BZ136_03730 [Methanosphaera sp. rholeuAM74]